MLKFDALVRGRVIGEGPDRQSLRVPQGKCSVEAFQGVVSLTWSEDGVARTALLELEGFEAALEAGALLITDAAQLRIMGEPAKAANKD